MAVTREQILARLEQCYPDRVIHPETYTMKAVGAIKKNTKYIISQSGIRQDRIFGRSHRCGLVLSSRRLKTSLRHMVL